MTPTKPSEVLRRAAQLIDTPEKWCQRADELDGKHCLMGAIMAHPDRDSAEFSSVYEDACEAIAEQVGFSKLRIVMGIWNDEPGRTHAEVLAALDRAASKLEAEGR